MRTIQLREYEVATVALDDSELSDLLGLPRGILDVSRQPDGLYRLRARSRVGAAVTDSLRVLIRPKVGLRNVFSLLAYANNIRWGDRDFPFDEDDMFRAVAWWFDAEVSRATRYGIHRGYVDREETLPTIRGRIALDRQVARFPGRRSPLVCRYQDYSEDTPLNRKLKAAHTALLRLPNLDRATTIRLRHRTRQFFGAVDDVSYVMSDNAKIRFDRLNRHWESSAALADLILRSRSIRDREGVVIGRTFTIDMNQLFERFLETIVREELGSTAFSLEPQARRLLTKSGIADSNVVVPPIRMRPDLLILAAGTPVAVADAKYKELLRIGDWEHPDIYQLIAYCVRLGLDRGLLIYAGARPMTESTVIGGGIDIRTTGVDLSGTLDDILNSARAATGELLDMAAAANAAMTAA